MTHENIENEPIGVIIVEDEAIIRMVAETVLCDCGFQVFVAPDAYEALRILESEAGRIRVLFTDVNMPGPMNGVTLAHHVRRAWPWISELITSGRGSSASAEMPEGSRFIAKPYDLNKVVRQIRDLAAAA
jgi:two-component system, response regulator PdtaR